MTIERRAPESESKSNTNGHTLIADVNHLASPILNSFILPMFYSDTGARHRTVSREPTLGHASFYPTGRQKDDRQQLHRHENDSHGTMALITSQQISYLLLTDGDLLV